MPNREEKFWNRLAKRYAKRPVPDASVYQTKLNRTQALLKPTDRVLEIGCGTGTTALHLAPHVAEFVATDFSQKMIEIARSKPSNARSLRFEVASVAESLALDGTPAISNDQPWDVVLAHSILHLLEDVPATLTQIHSRLTSGGLLISSTACLADFFPAFKTIGKLGNAVGLLPKVNVFSEAQLTGWLDEAEFKLIERMRPDPRSAVFLIHERL